MGGWAVLYQGLSKMTGYDVVRVVLGTTLLTAAALKGHQLATEPVVGAGLSDSRWFLIGVVEFELLFGLWLLAGIYAKWTWIAACLCFGCFAAVSLSQALAGDASCGCFGKLPIDPWYTFALDVAAVMALLNSCAEDGESQLAARVKDSLRGYGGRKFFWGVGHPLHRVVGVVGVSLAVGIPGALLMASYRPASLGSDDEIVGYSRIVLLEPQEWVGERFPLFNQIDVGNRLARGAWVLVLYHLNCPKCHEVIAKYERMASDSGDQPDRPRVALVEVPQAGASREGLVVSNPACVMGRLNESQEWFVSTPVVLSLENAIVTKLSEEPGEEVLMDNGHG